MDEEVHHEDLITEESDPFGRLLSPIVEADESSILETTKSEEHDDTIQLLNGVDPIKNDNEKTSYEDSNSRAITPPEILRKRITDLKSQIEYITTEHEELVEFTQLEKQIQHVDCIPKDELRIREDEFTQVNKKVLDLMKENSSLKYELRQKEAELKELETKLIKSTGDHNAVNKAIFNIGQEIQKNLDDNIIDEIIKNNSSLEYLSRYSSIGFIKWELEDIQNLFQFFISQRNYFKTQNELLQFSNVELHRVNDQLSIRLKELEESYFATEQENIKLRDKFTVADIKANDRINVLLCTENKLKESEELLRKSEIEKYKLQNQIDNMKNVVKGEDIQEKCIFILNKLEDFFDSINNSTSKKLKDVFDAFQEDNELTSFNTIIDSNVQTIFSRVISKLKMRLNFYDEEMFQLFSKVEEFKSSIKYYESETKGLKMKVNTLNKEHQQIKEETVKKINELENILNIALNEKTHFEEKFAVADQKLSTAENKIKETQNALVNTNEQKIILQKQIDSLKNVIKKDDIQEEYSLILNVLESNIDSWNSSMKFRDFFFTLLKDSKLLSCVNSLLSLRSKTIFSRVVDKIKNILNFYEEERYKIHLSVEQIQSRIETFESESCAMKMKIETLDCEINKDLTNRINGIENLLIVTNHEKVQLQTNLIVLGNQLKEKSKALSYLEGKLKEIENLLDSANNERSDLKKEIEKFKNVVRVNDIKKEFIFIFNLFDSSTTSLNMIKMKELLTTLKQKRYPCTNICKIIDHELEAIMTRISDKFERKFVMYEEEYAKQCKTGEELNNCIDIMKKENSILKKTIQRLESENNSLNEKCSVEYNPSEQTQDIPLSKELESFRKKMALEITSLDFDEKTESLLKCSYEELFSKLMQNIIRKEGEITSDLQKQYFTELEKKQETLEAMHNKLKSQESWITELENENDKICKELNANKGKEKEYECKIKTISNELKSSNTEVADLKAKVQELKNTNNILLADVDSFKGMFKNQKHVLCSVQNKVEELNEEVKAKTKIISELEYKLSSKTVLYNTKCVNNNEDALLKESSIKDGQENFEYESFEYSTSKSKGFPNPNLSIPANINNDNISSKLPALIENNNELNPSLIDALEQEKALLKGSFVNSNDSLSETLLTCSEKIFILKDVVQIIADKIMEMENFHKTSLKQFQNTINTNIKELDYFKLSISKLCEEFKLDYQNLEKNSENMLSETTCECDNVRSLKDELELAKEECTHITNLTNTFQQSAKLGQQMMQHLREEFQVLRYENTQKCLVIKDLGSTIKLEQKLNAEQKFKLEANDKYLNSLIMTNNLLESQVKHLQSELSDIMCKLSKFKIDLPNGIEDPLSKFSLLNIIYTEHVENKTCFETLTEDNKFFSTQFNLMHYYLENTEKRLVLVQEQKDNLHSELTELKEELTNTKTLLEEVDIFFKRLSLKLPIEISSTNQAAGVIEQIFSDNDSLKELLQECTAREQKLMKQLKELKLLKNLNSSLKLELAECEDRIRTLRSELRTVRVQCQRATNKQGEMKGEISGSGDHFLAKRGTTETGVQTGNLCCKDLEQEIFKQKDLLNTHCNHILELELQIQRESFPYKKKVVDLEMSLLQAKERIKALKFEVTQQQNYNKDLIEYHNLNFIRKEIG